MFSFSLGPYISCQFKMQPAAKKARFSLCRREGFNLLFMAVLWFVLARKKDDEGLQHLRVLLIFASKQPKASYNQHNTTHVV